MPNTQSDTPQLSTRDALLEATQRVIAREGIRAVTHRKVAAEAGVSLSATSYHLSNIQNILYEAMDRYVSSARERYEPSEEVNTPEQMVEAIIKLVLTIHRNSDDTVLMYELYAQAARDPRYFDLISKWSGATQESIRRVFDPKTSLKLETILEGSIFLRALTKNPIDVDTMRSALNDIIAAAPASASSAAPTSSASPASPASAAK